MREDFSRIRPRRILEQAFIGYPADKILTPADVEKALAQSKEVVDDYESRLHRFQEKEFWTKSERDLLDDAQAEIAYSRKQLATSEGIFRQYLAQQSPDALIDADILATFIGLVLVLPNDAGWHLSRLSVLARIKGQAS